MAVHSFFGASLNSQNLWFPIARFTVELSHIRFLYFHQDGIGATKTWEIQLSISRTRYHESVFVFSWEKMLGTAPAHWRVKYLKCKTFTQNHPFFSSFPCFPNGINATDVNIPSFPFAFLTFLWRSDGTHHVDAQPKDINFTTGICWI